MGFSGATPRRYIVILANPVAGAEFDLVPNQVGAWRILNLVFTFTASAAVATRQTGLKLTDGSNTAWFGVTPVTQAAGSAQIYQATPQGTPAASVGGIAQLALPPDGIFIPRGWHLTSNTAAKDVADQYSAIMALVEELPDGPDFALVPSVISALVPLDD